MHVFVLPSAVFARLANPVGLCPSMAGLLVVTGHAALHAAAVQYDSAVRIQAQVPNVQEEKPCSRCLSQSLQTQLQQRCHKEYTSFMRDKNKPC